jgi:NAD-dependent deacetylase
MGQSVAGIPSDLPPLVRNADRIVVLTGAGISAESGVPTFREAQSGLWAQYNPEDLATAAAFERDPELVWRWYAWRRELLSKAVPNPGHQALVEIESRSRGFTLITQNVDGLHARAGNDRILELHGSIGRVKCFRENEIVESVEESKKVPPECPNCGGPLRPDVVWFGESLPANILRRAFAAASDCDLLFSVGTSSAVQPAASLPYEAMRNGAKVVEINPEPTPLSGAADYVLTGAAGLILPQLVTAAWPLTSPPST